MGQSGHSLANLFPLMAADNLGDLAADIAAHGLRSPIVLHEDRVLDGRNRLATCKLARVEPRFEVFNGTEDEALHASTDETYFFKWNPFSSVGSTAGFRRLRCGPWTPRFSVAD